MDFFKERTAEEIFEILKESNNFNAIEDIILDLALKGKLVEQNSNDVPIDITLKQELKQKELLIKEKVIKNEKPLSKINENEKNFVLPNGWSWVRVANLTNFKAKYPMKRGPFGSAIKKDFFVPKGLNTFKVYEQKNAIYDDMSLGEYYINELKFKELKAFEVEEGDLIISCSGTVGKIGFLPKKFERGIINQALLKISINENVILKKYFSFLFKGYIMLTDTLSELKGTAIKNIPSMKILKDMPVPLPPIEEQKRIVEKVEILFEEYNNIKEEFNKLDLWQKKLVESFFEKFSNGGFNENNLDFIIKNVKELIYDTNSLNQFKASILQLGAQGKLVKQNSNDEPASILLKKIKKEKEQLIKEKKIKKEKPLSEITKDEIPYGLPNSWEWVRLSEILQFTKNGFTGKPNDDDIGIKRLGIETVTQSKFTTIDINMAKFIEILEEQKEKYFVKNNDIFICRQNGNLNYVGKAAVFNGNDNEMIFSDSLIQVRIFLKFLNSYYLTIFINSKLARKQLDEFCSTTAGNFSINGMNLKKLLVPLPPLEEQKRIVKKIDMLMAFCDELEQEINKSKQQAEQLMQSVLKEAFEQKEEMLVK